MTSFLRPPRIGIAAIIFCGMFTFAGGSGAARQATPAASPVAVTPGHPVHIHDGTCDALGGVAIPLNDVTEGAASESNAIAVELSVTRVEISIADILSVARAINVHQSVEDIDKYIACGNVAGTPNGPDLFVGIAELNASGQSGIAWLHENGDGSTTVSIFLAEGLSSGVTAPAGSPVATPGA